MSVAQSFGRSKGDTAVGIVIAWSQSRPCPIKNTGAKCGCINITTRDLLAYGNHDTKSID